MARVLQLRRGTNAENNLFTGAVGELTVDTTNEVLRIHDGVTQGGTTVGLDAGFMAPFAGTTAPDGWLICDGSAVSRTDYARLFAAIGTTYGEGDGNSTFNLPNKNTEFGLYPDYANATTITATTTEQSYTCPSYGFVVVDFAGFNFNYCYLKINDITMFNKTANSNGYLVGATGQYMVSAGDVCKFKSGYGNGESFAAKGIFMFVPLITDKNWCIKF